LRSRLELLHERLTRALDAPPDQLPTFTTREGTERAARAVERALNRYDAGDVAGAASELRDVDDVVVDTWEWHPIGRAYLDCRYALENRREVEEITSAQRETVLAADAAKASRPTRPRGGDRRGRPRGTPRSPRRRTLIAGGCAVLIVLGVVIVEAAFRPDYPKVTQRLSELYGAEVEWRRAGKYQRDDIILDGRNVGDHCVVEGEWFGLDDLRIRCDDPAYQPVRVK
jgi:hypothetical protein